MDNAPVQLIVAMFSSESNAQTGLAALKQAKKQKTIGLNGAILITKDDTGQKIHYKDVGITPAKGAMEGVVLGVALGVLNGGAGLALGAAGAFLGGLVGKKKQDKRFDVTHLNQVSTALSPGSAAIVGVIDETSIPDATEMLEELGADLLTTTITADLAKELQAHQEEAHAVIENTLED